MAPHRFVNLSLDPPFCQPIQNDVMKQRVFGLLLIVEGATEKASKCTMTVKMILNKKLLSLKTKMYF